LLDPITLARPPQRVVIARATKIVACDANASLGARYVHLDTSHYKVPLIGLGLISIVRTWCHYHC